RAAPGDRIGVIGPNGAGKTTLLNLLAGRKHCEKGHISLGETVTLGFFEQEIKDLQENETVLSNVRDIAEYIDVGVGRDRYISARELCDRFGFSPKQQHAFVHTLSGGERRRLGLLRILMSNPNVLFLDEPTNDFDLVTLNALEEYLQSFKGVLLTVSHDRAFLDTTVTTIWSFEDGGRIKEYPGNYSAYLEAVEARSKAADREAKGKQQQPPAQSAAKKKLNFNEQREFTELEKRIPELESMISIVEGKMSTSEGSYQDHQTWAEEHAKLTTELDNATLRWLELSERA
ncbi:MAG: ATP-binding cassette domain-containing protein, partial [Ignavibacteria bacterium]